MMHVVIELIGINRLRKKLCIGHVLLAGNQGWLPHGNYKNGLPTEYKPLTYGFFAKHRLLTDIAGFTRMEKIS